MGLLIKLKNGDTTLKSLKYGNDRPDGGDSGQPYIKSSIDQPSSISDEDIILRGGLKAPSSALEDVSRLTKYFFDFKNPDGLLFVAKQNILSRISSKTEASFGLAYGGLSQNINLTTGIISPNQSNGFFNEGVYTPLSTLAQAGVGYLGTHLNKQGLDPTGLISSLDINKYQDVAYKNNLSENNAYSGEVPLSLVRKSQRASDKAGRKLLARNQQLEKTANTVSSNPERTEVFTRAITPLSNLSNVTLAGVSLSFLGAAGVKGSIALEQQRTAFFEKWDRYVDNVSQRKFNRKDNASEKAFARQTNLYNQVLEEEVKVRYDNRLLNLWNVNYLNRDNPIDGPDPNPVLYSYGGGPSSVLGIGSTNIKFATKNDGLTPLRTTDGLFYPQKDYTRQVTYSTINIFGGTGYGENENNSVSFKYFLQSSNDFTSPEDIFGNFRPDVNDNTPDPDLGLFHSKYLDIFNSNNYKVINSNIYNNSTRPLVKYDILNIFNRGASITWASKNPSSVQNIFGKSTLNDYFNSFNNTPLDRLGLPFNTTSSYVSSLSTETSPYATWGPDNFASQTLNLEHVTLSDFRNSISPLTQTFTFSSQGYFYDMESIFNSSSPGQKGNISNYVKGKGIYNLTGPLDRITSSPIYKSNTSIEPLGRSEEAEYQDLIPFRIAVLNNELQKGGVYKKFMHFRAFIDNFSDGYNAEWKGIEYMGRAEKFYKYSGFSRDISIGFTVVAQSKKELTPMYDKLNFLASSLAPEYLDSSTTGYMAGNISYITVGDYLVEQPGIITSLDFEIPEESPWETARDQIGDLIDPKDVRRLPFMIKVKMKFIPIHKFRPSKQSFKNAPKGAANSTTLLEPGNQRYIDQSRPLVTNYDEESIGNSIEPYEDETFDEVTVTDPVIPAETLEESNVLLDTPTSPTNTNISSLTSNQGTEVTGLNLGQSAFNSFTSNNLFP